MYQRRANSSDTRWWPVRYRGGGGGQEEGEGGSYPRAGLFKWTRHSVGNGFGKRASLLSVREGIFRA